MQDDIEQQPSPTDEGTQAAAPAPEPSPEGGQEAAQTDKPKRNAFQARIGELTRAAREAERKAEYWERVAQQAKETPAEKPRRDAYEDADAYSEALMDWKLEQRSAQERKARSEEQARHAATQEKEAEAASFAERLEAFRAENPDFDEVMESAADVPMSPAMRAAITACDVGPAVAMHLAKHPQDAARIAALRSPVAAAVEIGRIAHSLSSPKAKPSNAPQPLTPVRGTGGRFEKAESAMSDAEWYAARKKA